MMQSRRWKVPDHHTVVETCRLLFPAGTHLSCSCSCSCCSFSTATCSSCLLCGTHLLSHLVVGTLHVCRQAQRWNSGSNLHLAKQPCALHIFHDSDSLFGRGQGALTVVCLYVRTCISAIMRCRVCPCCRSLSTSARAASRSRTASFRFWTSCAQQVTYQGSPRMS